MNQYERTNNDNLLLPVRLLAETRILRRPHAPMLPEREPRSMGCWSDDPAAYIGAFRQVYLRATGSMFARHVFEVEAPTRRYSASVTTAPPSTLSLQLH